MASENKQAAASELSHETLAKAKALMTPEMEESVKTLLSQSPDVMTAIMCGKVSMFDDDDDYDDETSNAKEKKIQEFAECSIAVLKRRAARKEERKKETEGKKAANAAMSIGDGENQLCLPDVLLPEVLDFLDKEDMIGGKNKSGKVHVDGVSLVSYEWAKACRSPLRPCWKRVYFDRHAPQLAADDITRRRARKNKFLAVIKLPRFALAEYMWMCNGFLHEEDREFLESVAKSLPNLQKLESKHSIHSSALISPAILGLKLSGDMHIDMLDPNHVVTFVQGNAGEGLQGLRLAAFAEKNMRAELTLSDHHLEAIALACPDIDSFHYYEIMSPVNLTSVGLETLVNKCTKLKRLSLNIASDADNVSDWRDFLQYLFRNAPSLRRLQFEVIPSYERSRDDETLELRMKQELDQLVHECLGGRIDRAPVDTVYYLKSRGKRMFGP